MAKRQTAVDESPKAPKYAKASIVEARIRGGHSNKARVVGITLKDQPEPMAVRSFNCDLPNRFLMATEELGWTPVEPREVKGGMSGAIREQDGRVLSGTNEVWMKMPARLYTDVQRSRADKLQRDLMSKAAMMKKTQRALERDANDAPRETAEQLERASDAVTNLQLDDYRVGMERVVVDPA